MSDTDQTGPGGTLINFPRIGFQLPPTTTSGTAIPPMPAHPPTTPTPAPGTGSRTARRSPLDALNALPDPGLTTPLLPVPAPPPGTVPATFRNQPGDMVGPRLGALGLAAILAVAVAAMRGTHTVLSTWWENRQARQTEIQPLREARLKHQMAMQAIRDKGAQQHAKTSAKVPSSSDFGRKSLGSRSGAGGSGGGSGSGRSSSSRTTSNGPGRKNNGGGGGTGPGSKSRTTNGPGSGLGGKNRSNGGRGPGGGGGRGNGPGNGPGKGPGPKKPTPLRTTQRGGGALKKAAGPNNNSPKPPKNPKSPSSGGGQGRTTLRKALTGTAQKTAAGRLKQRRNAGTSPVLWKKNPPATNGNGKNGTPQPGQPALGNGKTKNQKTPPTQPSAGGLNTPKTGGGRTTLAQALRKTAYRAARKRLKHRRHTVTPPVWTASGTRTRKVNLNKPKNTRHTPGSGTAGASASAGGRNGRVGQQNAQQRQQQRQNNNRWWARTRAYAKKKTTVGGCFGGAGSSTSAGSQGAGSNTSQPPPDGWATWDDYQQFLHANLKYRMGYDQDQRRSPFENAGQAAGQAGATITVERDDYPGAQAKRWEPEAITRGTPALPSTGPAALDTAPTVNPPRPGTTRPKEPIAMPPAPARQDPRITKARNQAARTGRGIIADARHMDAQHETEITLDDAIDEYDRFKDDAFKTHDQCHKLADRAIKLRDILIGFAEELAVKHNLIGPLFSAAMARMAESMDLVARMAEEMKTSSLQAAEMAEAADNDLNDAYRPYNMATADAGLSTPSAPIHNET